MKSLTVCLSSLLIFALIFSDTKVTAQQVPGTIIAHPGQHVELLCTITPSGSQTAAWIINHGVYTVQQLHNGVLTGYSSNGNNLIIENIMMNDDRNDTQYSCVTIPSTLRNPTVADTLNESNRTILYVAGVPAMVPNVTSTIRIDGNIVTLRLSWGELFNNLDPIMYYTVSCSGDVTCPPTFNTTDNAIIIGNLITMTTYTFSVVATNSIGSGEAGVVMITTPPGEATSTTTDITITATIITTTATTDATTTTVVKPSSTLNPQEITDDGTDNSGVVVAVVIVVVLLILVGCITMDILFCYCCKRKERHHQDNGEDKISHYCIIVLGVSTLGTSVLLWWLYKYFSDEDKYDVEAHSAVPLSSTKSSTKDGHKDKDEDKDAYKGSVEYDTIAEATSIQGSPPAVSYAATTQVLSKDTNTGPALQYDYARTGPLRGKADTKNQRIPEYAVVDNSKKKKKMDDKQQKGEQDIQQPQMGGHKQETELNYMDPSNLEFSEEPHNSAHKSDQTVQYGNMAETPQYTNVM